MESQHSLKHVIDSFVRNPTLSGKTKGTDGKEDVLYTLLRVYQGEQDGQAIAAQQLNSFTGIKC
jgi:hypothetical protein